jgi:hypothetical protein
VDFSDMDDSLGEFELKLWHIVAGVAAIGGGAALAYYLYKKNQGSGVFVTGQGMPGVAPAAASMNQCVKIGVQSEPIFDESDELIKAVRAAKAQGKKIFKVPTGNTAVTGTRDRFEEVTIWACPPGQSPPTPKRKTMSGDDDDEDDGKMSLLERTRRRIR